MRAHWLPPSVCRVESESKEADDEGHGTHRCPGRRRGTGRARARISLAAPRPAGPARRPEPEDRRQLALALGLAEALLAREPRRAAWDAVPGRPDRVPDQGRDGGLSRDLRSALRAAR